MPRRNPVVGSQPGGGFYISDSENINHFMTSQYMKIRKAAKEYFHVQILHHTVLLYNISKGKVHL